MFEQPELSIIILNYKMDGLLKNCLKSLYEHPTENKIEVIVVDNNSNDNSENIVKENFTDVKFIQAGSNKGHAVGNNIGIKASTGRYVMLLNPDVVFLNPIIDKVINFLDDNKTIGMATVQLQNPNGSIQAGAWKFYNFFTPLYQRSSFLQRTKRGRDIIANFTMQEWSRHESRDVDWVQGSCLITRRQVIEKIGLLDERFFLYFTDVDWCRRCWGAGFRVHYYAGSSAIHYYHRESASNLGIRALANKTTRLHIKDWIKYIKKYKTNLIYNRT